MFRIPDNGQSPGTQWFWLVFLTIINKLIFLTATSLVYCEVESLFVTASQMMLKLQTFEQLTPQLGSIHLVWNPKAYARVSTARVCFLSLTTNIQSAVFHPISIRFILFLSTCSSSCERCLPFKCFCKNFACVSHLFSVPYVLLPFELSLIRLNIWLTIGWPPLWSSGQNSWLQNGNVLCFLWGSNWIYVLYRRK
jgi:hypothetical protein